MEITQVKVFPVNEEKLKAYVSIVLDECFLVSDLKVIQGPNGLFISMPSKRKKNGEFKDIAHPLNRETRERMEKRILDEYGRVVAKEPGQPSSEEAIPEIAGSDVTQCPGLARYNSLALGRRQTGKAPAFGAGIWRFESSRPSQASRSASSLTSCP